MPLADSAQLLSPEEDPCLSTISLNESLWPSPSLSWCLCMPASSRRDTLHSAVCFYLVFELQAQEVSNYYAHTAQSTLHNFASAKHLPSAKELIASMFLCLARYASVASGEPSRIMRCIVIKLLKTTVHVESRSRYCSARNTSPTPASPACVATRMCSMYFVFGGAACSHGSAWSPLRKRGAPFLKATTCEAVSICTC